MTVQNAHIPRAGGASGTYFVCDGQRIYALPDSSLPAGCVEFKEYSVYYNQGFWILHGNATRPPLHEAWKKLYFDHEQDYSSYLTPAGQHSALACQRADQRWPRMLLPDIYHGPLTPYQQYGGLVGELPIFLALMAFSIGRDHVNWMFQNCFTDGRWLIHQYPSGREYVSPVQWPLTDLKIKVNTSEVWLLRCGPRPIPQRMIWRRLRVVLWESTSTSVVDEVDTFVGAECHPEIILAIRYESLCHFRAFSFKCTLFLASSFLLPCYLLFLLRC